MPPRSPIFPVLASCLVLSLPAAGQVGSNTLAASLLVDGEAAWGFSGFTPRLVAGGSTVTVSVAGSPGMPFILALGAPVEPGISLGGVGVAGILNLDLSTLNILGDGFATPTAPYLIPSSGSQSFVFSLAGLPPRVELTGQALVQTVSGPRLTAPARVLTVPGSPVPTGVRYRSVVVPTDAQHRHVVVNDFNNDGLDDVATSGGIYLATGNPAMPLAFHSLDPPGIEMACGDLVGDSNVDLLVMDNAILQMAIYAGDGTGLFYQMAGSTVVNAPVASWSTFSNDKGDVTLEDFDLDGDLDIVVSDGGVWPGPSSFPGIRVFENMGLNTFAITSAPAFFDASRTVTTMDINGDLIPDLVAETDGTTSVIPNPGLVSAFSGTTATSLVISGAPEPRSRWLRPVDMDNDGDLDLLWAGDQNLGVLINQGAGTFVYRGIPAAPNPGEPFPQLEAHDADGDGLLDVVFVDRTTGPGVWVAVAGQGPVGVFNTLWYVPVAADPLASTIAGFVREADLDGNGQPDLVVGGDVVTVLMR